MSFALISVSHDDTQTMSGHCRENDDSCHTQASSLMGVPSRASFGACSPGFDSNEFFRDLMRTHQVRLYRYVIRYIGHPDDAADITQQAFVEAASTISAYRGESAISTWLFGIARNITRNYLNRSPSRLYKFESESALDEIVSDRADPSENVERKEFLQHVVVAIHALPTEMRQVMMMLSFGESSYDDIAKSLNISMGTVCSRVSRARAILKATFPSHLCGISTPKKSVANAPIS